MKELLTQTMDKIEEECRAEGYYPDLVELYEMAMAYLNNMPSMVYQLNSRGEIS